MRIEKRNNPFKKMSFNSYASTITIDCIQNIFQKNPLMFPNKI